MQIPKRFKLCGQTIEIEMDPSLLETDDARGMAFYRSNKIKLNPAGTVTHPQSHVEQSFCHELVHYLFNYAGYQEDRADEIKVERISNLLHQALTTQEFE